MRLKDRIKKLEAALPPVPDQDQDAKPPIDYAAFLGVLKMDYPIPKDEGESDLTAFERAMRNWRLDQSLNPVPERET